MIIKRYLPQIRLEIPLEYFICPTVKMARNRLYTLIYAR